MPTNAVVEIGYNEPLNASTMTAANVFGQLELTGVNAASTIRAGCDGDSDPDRTRRAALQPNKLYCYYVQAGVQGSNGLAAQQRGGKLHDGMWSADGGADSERGESGEPAFERAGER